MHLRTAKLSDAPVLAAWGTQPHVIAASGDDDTFDWLYELPRKLSWRELLIAETGDRPIGFLQIIDPAREETHYWGEVAKNLRAIDIWIGEPVDLNCGYGTQMMQLALQRCFVDPKVSAVLIDPLVSNVRAHRFYERLGFKKIEERQFGHDDCFVYQLGRSSESS